MSASRKKVIRVGRELKGDACGNHQSAGVAQLEKRLTSLLYMTDFSNDQLRGFFLLGVLTLSSDLTELWTIVFHLFVCSLIN